MAYKSDRNYGPGVFPGTAEKQVTVTDKDTSEKGKATGWDHESWKDVEERAIERIEKDK